MRRLVIALSVVWVFSQSAQGAVLFTDNFNTNGTDSPPWGNQLGNWSAHNGTYSAANPGNSPTTYSSLTGFDVTDFSFQVDVNDVSDGGIWLRSNFNGGNFNGVLLVIGGAGYGSGGRGGGAGQELYWHVVTNGSFSTPQDVVQVLTPGENATVRVDVVGNTYRAYVNNVLETTLVDNTFSHGQVGLYDFYSGLSFDNAVLTSTVVPEPSSAVIFCTLFGGMIGYVARISKRKTATADGRPSARPGLEQSNQV